jgi:radical SAM superfamily enzyme YgiQ (UPF0313 family)
VRYVEPVFRPPSEADSFLLQVTLGCSHNRCTFCAMYGLKTFRVRPEAEIRADIIMARRALGSGVRRAFLCDGDAFVLSPRRIRRTLDLLHTAWPNLGRVGSYANARDVMKKSPEDLRMLRENGLGILYFGLESGDPEVLREVDKGATPDQIIAAVRKAEEAGIKTSVMVLIGLAGRDGSEQHARRSAEVASRMNPRFLSFLTVTPVPGTPFGDAVERGEIGLLDPDETLREIRMIVEGLDLRGTVFRCNHASNYLPLRGRLPQDKARLLVEIDAGLSGDTPLRPEFLRGL